MTVKKTKSKELIQIAFYELLEEKDFEAISIKEICEKAGVSRMSFYRYYSTKEDIFIVICDETFDRFFHRVVSMQLTTIKEMLLIFFQGLEKSKDKIEILKKAGKETILLSLFEQYCSYLVSKTNVSLLKSGTNPYSTPYFAGAIYNVFIRWSNRYYAETPEQIVDIIDALVNRRG